MTRLLVAIGGFRLHHCSLTPLFSAYAVPAEALDVWRAAHTQAITA
jgi:hypothetical protein